MVIATPHGVQRVQFPKIIFAQHVLNAAGDSSSFAGSSVVKGLKMVQELTMWLNGFPFKSEWAGWLLKSGFYMTSSWIYRVLTTGSQPLIYLHFDSYEFRICLFLYILSADSTLKELFY